MPAKKHRRITSTRMRKAPKGWIKAKFVRVVTRNGKKVVEVKR